MFQDQTLDFDNSVRGIEFEYSMSENVRLFGLSGRGKYGYKTGKNLTGRVNDIYIDNTLFTFGLEYGLSFIPGELTYLNINLHSKVPAIEDEGIEKKSLIIDMNNLGLIGKKIGMTREFFPSGLSIPVTVIKIEKGRIIDFDDVIFF